MKLTFDINEKTKSVNLLRIEGGNDICGLQGKFIVLDYLKTSLHNNMTKEQIANCNLCKLQIAIDKYLRGEKENQISILCRSCKIFKKYGSVIYDNLLCSVLQDSHSLLKYRRDYDKEEWNSMVDYLVREIDEYITKYLLK